MSPEIKISLELLHWNKPWESYSRGGWGNGDLPGEETEFEEVDLDSSILYRAQGMAL